MFINGDFFSRVAGEIFIVRLSESHNIPVNRVFFYYGIFDGNIIMIEDIFYIAQYISFKRYSVEIKIDELQVRFIIKMYQIINRETCNKQQNDTKMKLFLGRQYF